MSRSAVNYGCVGQRRLVVALRPVMRREYMEAAAVVSLRVLVRSTVAFASSVLVACGGNSPESLVAKGKLEFEGGRPKDAAILLKSALQAKPTLSDARCLLGRALLKAEEPAAAAVELTKCMNETAARDAVLPDLARALMQGGESPRMLALYGAVDLKEPAAHADLKTTVALAWGAVRERQRTEAAVRSALAALPDHPPALLLRARERLSAGDVKAAEKIVDDILARDSKVQDAWQLKGELLAVVANDAKAAEDAFLKALAIENRYLPAHASLVSLRLQANDLKGAKEKADTLRALLPAHPQTVFIDAYIAAKEKNLALAREKTQAVLKVLPDNTGVLQLAGAIEGELGALVQAERYYAKALSLEPLLYNARRNMALAQLRLGRPAKAWETLLPLTRPDSTDAEALALAGEAALATGDAASAERMFTRAAGIKPDDRKVRTSLALSRLARGDGTDAFSSLRALSAESSDTYVDLAIVSAHLKRFEFEPALAAVDRLALKKTQGAVVHELRGRVLAAKGDLPAARQALERAQAADPKSFAAVASLTELDIREAKLDQAEARLKQAVVKDADNATLHLLLARLMEQRGAPIEELRRVIGEGIKLAPRDAIARVQLVDTNLRRRQTQEALAAAQQAEAAIPDDLEVLDALGRTQALAGDTQQALSTFQRIVGLEPNVARPHVRLAALHRETGNVSAAVASLRRAVEVDASQAQARIDLVNLLVNSKKGDQALKIASEIQQRNAVSEVGYLLESTARLRLNDRAAAVAALRRGATQADNKAEITRQLYRELIFLKRDREAEALAVEWVSKHPDDAGMLFELGSAALSRNDLDQAEKYFRRSIALRSDHPIALNNLAWILVTRGKPGALPLVRRAADLLPDKPAILDTLAQVLVSEKQYAEALSVHKKAVELAPLEMELRLNMAKTAVQAGDKTLAKAELDKLAGLGSRFPLQAEVARLQKQL